MSRVKLVAVLLSLCVLLGACQTTQTAKRDSSNDLIAPELIKPGGNELKTGFAKKLVYEDTGKVKSSVIDLKKEYLTWKYQDSKIVEIHVTKNQRVSVGQTLITFENVIDKVELEALKLQLTNKQQEVDQARQQKLDAIDQAKAALEGLTGYELQLAQLKADQLQVIYERYVYESDLELQPIREKIAAIEEKAADNKLVAQYNGIIDYINVNLMPGFTVNPELELINIRATDKSYLTTTNSKITVYSAESLSTYLLRYNQPVVVGGHEGRVIVSHEILPHMEGASTAAVVELIDGTEETSQNNALMNFTIHEIYDVLLVSSKALDDGSDDGTAMGPFTVKVLEDGVIKKRQVSVGLRNQEGYAIILEGLSPDQVVIFKD